MFRSQLLGKILGDAALPVLTAVYLIYLAYTKEYRKWRIYKAIMGSSAKTETREDPFLLSDTEKESPPSDTPPKEEPKE